MKKGILVLAAAAALLAAACPNVAGGNAAPAKSGTVEDGSCMSAALGKNLAFRIYLPGGYATSGEYYPVVYMLHGRGDSMSAWEAEKSDLDSMIAAGAIQPIIAVMPDFSANNGAGYYVDSAFTGSGDIPAGQKLETAFFSDLVPYVDTHYNTIPQRSARAVAGYSMGGYGAIRYSLAHSDVFRAAIILSPAVYSPLPPTDSSTREYGAFGVGSTLFDDAVYEAKNYTALFSSFEAAGNKMNWFIAVGDGEVPPTSSSEADLSIDVQSAILNGKARYVKNMSSELRVLNGGHNWDVWKPGFIEGAKNIFAVLDKPTSNADRIPSISAGEKPAFYKMIATAGDDVSGGVATDASGDVYTAAGAMGSVDNQAQVGDMDVVLQKFDSNGNKRWTTQFGTTAKDCPCGIGTDSAGFVYVAGYTQGVLDPSLSASYGKDDFFVAKLSQSTGDIVWEKQFGTSLADRFYCMAVDPSSGSVYAAGYTKGVLAGTANAGDKDIILVKYDTNGAIQWKDQFGSASEDKAWGLALSPDGTKVYVSGLASGQIGGDSALGGADCFLTRYGSSGSRDWIRQFGTSGDDEAYAVAVSADGTPYITGYTTGSFVSSDTATAKDIIVASFDSKGNIAWKDQIGSTTGSECTERGAGIAFGSSGRMYVSAFSDGEFKAGCAQGSVDAVIFRYEGNKTRSCLAQFGGAGVDGAYSWYEPNQYLAIDGSNIYMSGYTLGDFIDATHLGTGDTGDVFLVKYTD